MEYIMAKLFKNGTGQNTILSYEKEGEKMIIKANHFKSLRESSNFFLSIIGQDVFNSQRGEVTILGNDDNNTKTEQRLNTDMSIRTMQLNNGVSVRLAVRYCQGMFFLKYKFSVAGVTFHHSYELPSAKTGIDLIQSLTEDDVLEVYKVLAKGLVEVIPNTL